MKEHRNIDYDEETVLAQELLEAGVPQTRVKEIFQGRIHWSVLQDLVDGPRVPASLKNGTIDPNIKRLVDEMKAPDNFLDPLYQHIMNDPVAISSGHIFDRSSVLDSNGELKFRRCPFTGKSLHSTVVALAPNKREIDQFKATRDRNVNEIARKMISSGDFESFHAVLEGVETYIKGHGDNYLPLARELASMWSGVREASCVMLLVESLESQPYSRTCQTVVASGGIEDRVFRIIVSAEYYRDRAKRDDRSGLFLSLYNDRDLLVERSKIFTSQGYGRNTSTKNHHIFGKHDQIVTKSKVGYFYKVEYKPSDSDSMVEVQGLMCKIFPESGRRTSYKMQDAEGDQGLFMGAVDSRDRAHGQGVLDYEDGKRFVGSFHSGSIADGVLYRGAHVTHTLHQGKWTESNDASLVRKYPVSMLVYDSLEKSRSRGGTSNSNRTQYQASNRHHSAPRRSAYNDDASYHSGYRSHASKRPGMINTSFEETFVSALPAHGSGARHNDDIDELFSHQRGRPRSANKQRLGKVASKGGYETALPAGALPALQGGMRFIDDDDSVDMSRSPHGLRSARSAESLGSRVSFADRRNDINGVREKVTEQGQHKVDADGDERIYPLNRRALADDMGGLFAPGRNGKCKFGPNFRTAYF